MPPTSIMSRLFLLVASLWLLEWRDGIYSQYHFIFLNLIWYSKRISLFVMTITGKYLGLLLLGFMVTAYVLSMWISNTAAALIMVI